MLDKRQLGNLIRSMGGRVEQIKADKILIYRDGRAISLINPDIIKVVLQDKATYMISFEREELEPKEDELELIMSMKSVDKDKAYEMFKKAGGDLSKILGD